MSSPLAAYGVLPQNERFMQAMRVIVGAAADPDVAQTLDGLAIATGLTREVVRHVLGRPEYRELIEHEIKNRVATLLQKSVRVLERHIGDENPRVSLDAIRTTTALYKTLTTAANGHERLEGNDNLKIIAKELDVMNAMKRADATIVGGERLGPAPEQPDG